MNGWLDGYGEKIEGQAHILEAGNRQRSADSYPRLLTREEKFWGIPLVPNLILSAIGQSASLLNHPQHNLHSV